MIILLSLIANSFAWDNGQGCYDTDYQPAGNYQQYHITNTLSSANKNAIEDGINAWSNVPVLGAAIVGVDFEFDRGTDATSPSWGNNVNEVYTKDQTWFTANCPGAWSCTFTSWDGSCNLLEWDMFLNSGKTWTDKAPSKITDTSHSLGQTAMHEAGHVIGLIDWDWTDTSYPPFYYDEAELSVMNSAYPYGGDVGEGNHRVYADDVEGQVFLYTDYWDNGDYWEVPGGEHGYNMALSRFTWNGTQAREVWTDQNNSENGHTWHGQQNAVITTMPSGITGFQTGMPAIREWPYDLYEHQDGEINWYLVAARADCWPGHTRYWVGATNLGNGFNDYDDYDQPPIQPDSFTVPNLIQDGSYYLCAEIDNGDSTTEISDDDNNIVSEKIFTVN